MDKTVEKLPQRIKIKGIGKLIFSTLVDRTNNKAWYKRDDNVYEIFKIKIEEEKQIFGKHYPRKEKYPNNEDFGKWAWCFNKKENAQKKYNQI